ncbi:MAG: 2-oxo acid dehydrogenase subunit E2 [Halioglobus sp.]|nr:2-oxo acid dehydrogenase subunit E2 [Halioglobus sp.]
MSEIYPIAVPKWGIEMVEGTINSWNKREGDNVTKGDEVFDMESDKIVNVWESPVNGVLRRIIATEGDAYPVGALLGVIAAAAVSDADIDAFIAGFGGASSAEKSPKPAAPAAAGAAPNDAAARTNPVVRKLAEELGVDLGSVVGTGRNGRITQEDVQAAAAGAVGEDAADKVDIIPLSATRKTIARRLTEAKQTIPHFYLGVEYELDGLLARRKVINEGGQSRVSVNDLIVWCVAQALVREPRVNVNLVGDDIHQFRQAHVSVALATDDGLYPATIRNADTLTVAQIAAAGAALAEKARTGTLTREDISGGSFTVSNLGMLGVSNFTAIINPPMGAILALGKAEQKMVVKDGKPVVATMISATLSCDHRIIDGAVGARFLQVLGEQLTAL